MVPGPVGRTSQPLAYPSTSWRSPTDPVELVAFHPALWLWPRTSQNGLPLVRTLTSSEVALDVVTRVVAPDEPAAAPRADTVVAAPSAPDDSTRRSTSIPVSRPGRDSTRWLPRRSASGAPQARSSSPERASLTGPRSRTGTGRPSTLTSPARQMLGTSTRAAGFGTPANPASAIDTGSVWAGSGSPGMAVSRRTCSMTRRRCLAGDRSERQGDAARGRWPVGQTAARRAWRPDDRRLRVGAGWGPSAGRRPRS